MLPRITIPSRQLSRMTSRLLCLLALGLGHASHALDEVRILEFRLLDYEYIEKAGQQLNARLQQRFGTSFRGERAHDLPLLQRLLDEKQVAADELEMLQAMGVVLGEVLRSEYPLDWVRYLDGDGVSRALKLRHQENIVFPITAISRRASVGAPVDVAALYEKLRQPIAQAYQR